MSPIWLNQFIYRDGANHCFLNAIVQVLPYRVLEAFLIRTTPFSESGEFLSCKSRDEVSLKYYGWRWPVVCIGLDEVP